MGKLMIDEEGIIAFLQELVRIDSVNPRLVPDGAGERTIAEYIADSLRNIGLNPRLDEIETDRFNVTAILEGSGGGRSLLLNGHMDTVGVDGMADPFSGLLRDGKVYGRGAQDMKGSIAAMIGVMQTLCTAGIDFKGDVIFAAVADEEYASIGTEHLIKDIHTDAAIVTEPTELDICVAHRGFALFDFRTSGVAAHGGRPQEGIDANIHMGKILYRLGLLANVLEDREGHRLLGPPSLHVPLVKGGSELFVYSDQCQCTCERRLLPGENLEQIYQEFLDLLECLKKEDETFDAVVQLGMHRYPFETSTNAEIVTVLNQSVGRVRGKPPAYIGHSWWEDSALLAEEGMDTVIIGPKGAGLHTHEEWVDVQSVIDLTRILVETIVEFCA